MNNIIKIIFLIFILIFIDELIGYWWHRYVAHNGVLGDIIRKPHYEHHEIHYPHHDMLSEKYRVDGFFEGDSWPWLIPTVVVLFALWVLYKTDIISFTTYVILSLWVPFHIYIVSYIHDSYHITNHWLNNFSWYKRNKKYHDLHHYYNCNYGISNYSMDYLFGTVCKDYDPKKSKENIFRGYVHNK